MGENEILTLMQMELRFPSQWLLVENPQTGAALELQGGTVLWHSSDRDEVYRKAVELRPHRFAVTYTGKMPKNTAIVLWTSPSIPTKD
jgi:hypothetical protein